MKLEITRVCAGLIIVLALLMCLGTATETNWRFSGFELYGYDINFTSHNATNVKNIDAENITSEKIGGVIYADQYPTLQDAINASTGGIVYIPPGIYDLAVGHDLATFTDSPLKIKSNITLMGAGDSTILNMTGILSAADANIFITNSDPVNGNINIEICNLQILALPQTMDKNEYIDGSGETEYAYVINMVGVNKLKIHGLNISNGMIALRPNNTVWDTADWRLGTTSNYEIYNNIAYHPPEFVGCAQTTYGFIHHNIVYRSIDNGISLNCAGENIEISNNILDSELQKTMAYGGIEVNNALCGGAIGMSNINVHDNIVLNNQYSGAQAIYVNGATNTQIHNNIIDNNNNSNMFISECQHTIISNNILSNGVKGISLINNNNENLTIVNNIFENHTTGILIGGLASDLSDIIILNNLFSNSTFYDIDINAGGGYLNDCIISGNKLSGYRDSWGFANGNNNILFNNLGLGGTYWGLQATAPTPFGAGDEYFNTTDNIKYCYNGAAWNALY